MIKSLLFLFLVTTAFSSAVAQADFRSGYIVQVSGDTLVGQVAYQGAQRSALLCRFRTNEKAAVTAYQPSQLRAYGFKQGPQYQSQVTAALARGAFLEILASGKVTLFTLVDENDHRRYYAKNEVESPVELLQQDTLLTRPGVSAQQVKVRSYPFRSVLSTMLTSCPSIQAQVVRAELTESQLVRLVVNYNACATGATPATVAPKSTRFQPSVVLGVQRGRFVIDDDGEEKIHSAVGPAIGLGVTITPPRFNEKLSMRVEILGGRQVVDATYSRQGSGIYLLDKAERRLEIDVTSLHLITLLRYARTAGVIRPFVQAGPQVARYVKRQGTLTSTTTGGPSAGFMQPIGLRSYRFGGALSAGLLLPLKAAGTFQVEARVDMMDSLDFSGSLSAATTSVLVGYTMGK